MAGLDTLQPGLWVPAIAPYCMQQASAVAANFARGVRFVAPKSMTITKVGICLTVAATVDDPVDVGIYQWAGSGQAINRLGSTGALNGILNAAPGNKILNLLAPVALVGGQVYYAAAGCGTVGGTAAQLAGVASSCGTLFGSSVPLMEMITMGGFPLPASYPTPGAPGSAPIIALLQ